MLDKLQFPNLGFLLANEGRPVFGNEQKVVVELNKGVSLGHDIAITTANKHNARPHRQGEVLEMFSTAGHLLRYLHLYGLIKYLFRQVNIKMSGINRHYWWQV